MKKIITLIAMIAITTSVQAALTVAETFTYAPGNAWIGNSEPWYYSGNIAPYSTVAGDMATKSGQYSQPAGNHFYQDSDAATFTEGNYAFLQAGSEITSGVRYDSMTLKVGDITTLATAYTTVKSEMSTLGFDKVVGKINFLAVRKDLSDASKINLGFLGRPISKWEDALQWDTTKFDPTQDIFLVFKNDDVDGDWTGSRISIFVNPGPVTESFATALFTTDARSGDVFGEQMCLHQHATVDYEVDNWRVGDDWHDVVIVPEPALLGLLGLGVLAFIRRK